VVLLLPLVRNQLRTAAGAMAQAADHVVIDSSDVNRANPRDGVPHHATAHRVSGMVFVAWSWQRTRGGGRGLTLFAVAGPCPLW